MLDATDRKTISVEYDSDLEEDEYEVEKILKHRVVRHGRERITEYYIKWRGFDEHWNSWEPENKVDAENLVDEYWQGRSKKKPSASQAMLKRQRTPKDDLTPPTISKRPNTSMKEVSIPVVPSTTNKDHSKSSKQSRDTRREDRSFDAGSEGTESTMLERRFLSADASADGVVPTGQPWQNGQQTEEVVFDLDFRTELSWNWERSITSVEAVTHEGPVLYGVVRWNDGALAMYPTGLIRRRCAQKLIDFYEKKLEFPEADAGLLISN